MHVCSGQPCLAAPTKLTIIDTAAEESIIDTIENAAMHSTLVIVDLEGTASMMTGFDATFTSIESEKRGFRPNQSIAQLKNSLPKLFPGANNITGTNILCK